VLPKVSSALAQLIKPIAPRAVQSQDKRQERQNSSSENSGEKSGQKTLTEDSGFQRFKKDPLPAPENPLENKIIPFPLKTGTTSPAPPPPATPEKRGGTGLTDALLQLKAVIQEQSSQVSQWIAGSKYKAESQSKKKQISGKRGAIVDHKAE
jgi:hypothetical protein